MLTDERIREIAEEVVAHHEAVGGPDAGVIESAIRQALAEAQEWVSVEERLPGIEVPVFGQLSNGSVIVVARDFLNADEGWLWGNTYDQYSFIDGKWQADNIEVDDEYEVVRWKDLPIPPAKD